MLYHPAVSPIRTRRYSVGSTCGTPPACCLHANPRLVNDNNTRGKEDNVDQHRTIGFTAGIALGLRVAFATAPEQRHEC